MHTHINLKSLTIYGPNGGLAASTSTLLRRVLERHTYRLNLRSMHLFSVAQCGERSLFEGRLRKLGVCEGSKKKGAP